MGAEYLDMFNYVDPAPELADEDLDAHNAAQDAKIAAWQAIVGAQLRLPKAAGGTANAIYATIIGIRNDDGPFGSGGLRAITDIQWDDREDYVSGLGESGGQTGAAMELLDPSLAGLSAYDAAGITWHLTFLGLNRLPYTIEGEVCPESLRQVVGLDPDTGAPLYQSLGFQIDGQDAYLMKFAASSMLEGYELESGGTFTMEGAGGYGCPHAKGCTVELGDNYLIDRAIVDGQLILSKSGTVHRLDVNGNSSARPGLVLHADVSVQDSKFTDCGIEVNSIGSTVNHCDVGGTLGSAALRVKQYGSILRNVFSVPTSNFVDGAGAALPMKADGKIVRDVPNSGDVILYASSNPAFDYESKANGTENANTTLAEGEYFAVFGTGTALDVDDDRNDDGNRLMRGTLSVGYVRPINDQHVSLRLDENGGEHLDFRKGPMVLYLDRGRRCERGRYESPRQRREFV